MIATIGTKISTPKGEATVVATFDHAVRVKFADKAWQRRAAGKADLIFPSDFAAGIVKVVR